ncbi:hypothetical protein [Cronobacter sakazakii]|nr:hypothetical protein [Cronobacter sakazakii]
MGARKNGELKVMKEEIKKGEGGGVKVVGRLVEKKNVWFLEKKEEERKEE